MPGCCLDTFAWPSPGNSNLHGHTELSTSSPESTWPRCHGLPVCPVTPSANPRALALQSLHPQCCWFCFLKTSLTSLCTSVVSTAATPSWRRRHLPPPWMAPLLVPSHPAPYTGRDLPWLPTPSSRRRAPSPSSLHSSPVSRGPGLCRLTQQVALPPAPFLRSAWPALPHAHPVRQPHLCVPPT